MCCTHSVCSPPAVCMLQCIPPCSMYKISQTKATMRLVSVHVPLLTSQADKLCHRHMLVKHGVQFGRSCSIRGIIASEHYMWCRELCTQVTAAVLKGTTCRTTGAADCLRWLAGAELACTNFQGWLHLARPVAGKGKSGAAQMPQLPVCILG